MREVKWAFDAAMFGRPVHTLQSATSGWRDLWLNTGANLSPSYSPLQQTPRVCPVLTRGRWFRPSPKSLQTSFSSDNYSSTAWQVTPNRLGDLQISKITRQANINLSLWIAQLSLGLGLVFSRDLPWDAHSTCVWEFQQSSQPELAGRCGVFIGGDPNGEMTEVTRCDSLTCVHNGQISNQCTTLLEEQESWLTEWVLSRRHKVWWLFLRAITQLSEISLGRLSL